MSQNSSLPATLDEYGAAVIKTMTEALRGEALPYKQSNLTYLLAELPKPARIQAAFAKLAEQDKLVLTWLHSRGGQAGYGRLRDVLTARDQLTDTPTTGRIARIEGRQRRMPKINPNAKGKTYFENVVARLTKQGLLFSRGVREIDKTKLNWLHGKIIFLPDYVKIELDKRPLMSLPERVEATPAFSRSGNASGFQRDLGRMARYVTRVGTVQLTTQGALYKNVMRELANLMSFKVNLSSGKKEFDNGRLYFIRRLLPKLDLVDQRYGSGPMTAVPDAYFWQLPLTKRIDQCFRAWRDDGAWNELHQLHHYKRGMDRNYDAPKGLRDSRRTILAHVKRLGSGWISIYELIEELRDQDYGFLFEKRKYSRGGWGYYNYNGGGSHPYTSSNNPYSVGFEGISSEKDGWDKVEADFINHVLAGPLHWLGLVHLGYSSEPKVDFLGNNHIDAYCLTPFGEWLVGLAQEPETAVSPTQLIVQPNFEIVVMGNSDGEMLLTMDQFADSVNESEHASTFAISRESIYRGQQGGWPTKRIIAFLEEQAGQPVPQNVQRTLEEWGALQERIVIRRNVRLLETADEEMGSEMMALLGETKTRQLEPTLLISEETADLLDQKLAKAGHLPQRTRAEEALPSNSIVTDESGSIRFTQRVPTLFTRRALANVTADTGDGRVLTKPLVKTAVAHTGFGELLTLLRRLHRGPIPKPLILKLKAWCDYYGAAQQQTVTLIEFKDEATRDELVSDPDLRGLLTLFPAQGRALAIAQADKLNEIHAELQLRGINIAERPFS